MSVEAAKAPLGDLNAQVASTAERFVGQKEVADNRGDWVDSLNKRVGSPVGSSWCAAFSCCCALDVKTRFHVTCRLKVSGSVRELWKLNPNLQKRFPDVGDIVCWGFKGTSSGHSGVVVEVDPKGEWIETVEGNTYDHTGAEIVREGDGVYRVRRAIKLPDSSSMVCLGFLRCF